MQLYLQAINLLVGIGSGQPSRLDSCQIAIDKMNKFIKIKNEVVAASDAFFPFVDGIEKLSSIWGFCCYSACRIN